MVRMTREEAEDEARKQLADVFLSWGRCSDAALLLDIAKEALVTARRECLLDRAKEREAIVAYILRRISGDGAINGRPASNVLYETVDAIEGGDHLVPEAEAIQRWHRRLDHAEERERNAIVQWLRHYSATDAASHADAIERCEHHGLRERHGLFARLPRKFWVIMANDYPAGIATTEADRDRMVAELDAKYRAQWKEEAKQRGWMQCYPKELATRVYVHAYEFEPDKVSP